jgi:hypothetical protein
VSVESIAGTRSGAWSWPDVATLSVDLDPARPLRRVQTLAEEAISWLQSSLNDSQLTLTSKGWWGNASVQVAVTPDGGGTQLRLRAGSRVLANNLIARAVIARVVEEIATKPEWTQP